MKNIKICFQAFTLLTVVWFSSMGCVTKQVWTDPVKGSKYNESIISFYTNFEKNEIVFIGKEYHYFFEERTEAFMELLKAKKLLELSDKHLQIHASTGYRDPRKMRANMMVHFKKSELNTEQQTWIEEHGFHLIHTRSYFGESPDYYHESNESLPLIDIYTMNYHIEGHRYVASSAVNNQVVKLKKPLFLSISEFKVKHKKSTLYKVAMTPLSVTADAGLIVVGVGAAIVYAPFFLTYMAYEKIRGI